jgi:tetratricopeptide (TPR) repeat protein
MAMGVGTFLALPPVAGAAGPQWVNPTLATSYERVTAALGESQDADAAIKQLQTLRTQDATNALPYYLLAAAYGQKGDWDKARNALLKGNQQPRYVAYQRNTGPMRLMMQNATLRQLARSCQQSALDLPPDKGTALVKGIRTMGKKVALQDPPDLLAYLVGLSLRSIADSALETVYQKANLDLADVKKLQEADQTYRDQVIPDAKKTFGEDPQESFAAEAKKRGLPLEQVQAYALGKPVSSAVRQKLEAWAKQDDARIRGFLQRWSKQMPD